MEPSSLLKISILFAFSFLSTVIFNFFCEGEKDFIKVKSTSPESPETKENYKKVHQGLHCKIPLLPDPFPNLANVAPHPPPLLQLAAGRRLAQQESTKTTNTCEVARVSNSEPSKLHLNL